MIWSGRSEIPNCIRFQVHVLLPVFLQQWYSTTDPHPPGQAPHPPSPSPGPALPIMMHHDFFKPPSRWAANWGSMLKIAACCHYAAAATVALHGGASHCCTAWWCVIQPLQLLHWAVTAAAAKCWSIVNCEKLSKHRKFNKNWMGWETRSHLKG